MALINKKQISRILAARMRVNGFSAGVSTSAIATTGITTACSTGGDNGSSVSVTPSSGETVAGIISTAPNNVALIYTASTELPIIDSSGNEVYGRITESVGVYTISYYSLVSGVETAFTMTGQTIDFEFAYRYEFNDLPADAIISLKSRNIADDPSESSGIYEVEALTVTATNTISNISNTNINTSKVIFYVNGQAIRNSTGISTTSGGVVTVAPITLGYSVETTDQVFVSYTYLP